MAPLLMVTGIPDPNMGSVGDPTEAYHPEFLGAGL
jgi:hypothetical protein